VEICAYLTDRGFPNTPTLGGMLEYRSANTVRSLGIFTKFIAGATDGWGNTLDALGRYFDSRVPVRRGESQLHAARRITVAAF
jgi:hypothetical protein